MDVGVSLVQLRCDAQEPAPARVHRALDLIDQASADAAMVMLPELWICGAFDLAGVRPSAQAIDGELVELLRARARQHRVWLHGGSFPERAEDGQIYNTSVLIDDRGDIAATYRKIHLFGFADGERTVVGAGHELVLVDTPLGRTGLATCYDLRFPEMFRRLTVAGATAFMVTSGWPTRRIGHWDVLARARAIENQAWMLACNEVGEHAGTVLGGHSVVIDPLGEPLAAAGEAEEILRAVVDTDAPVRWRETFPVLQDITVLDR